MNKPSSAKTPPRPAPTHPKLPKDKTKRRKSVPYTAKEMKYIIKGVKRYKNDPELWYAILNDTDYEFHPQRTSQDLRDKHRNMEASKNKKATPTKKKPFRSRVQWTTVEDAALIQGYERYKNVKTPWIKILRDEDFKGLFNTVRNNTSLKDRMRVLRQHEQRMKEEEEAESSSSADSESEATE